MTMMTDTCDMDWTAALSDGTLTWREQKAMLLRGIHSSLTLFDLIQADADTWPFQADGALHPAARCLEEMAEAPDLDTFGHLWQQLGSPSLASVL